MPSTGNCSAGSDCSRSRVSIAEVAVRAEGIKSSGHVAPLIFLVRAATASTAVVCQRSAARDPIVSRVTPPGGTGSNPAAGIALVKEPAPQSLPGPCRRPLG
jgi:hypothetical protein